MQSSSQHPATLATLEPPTPMWTLQVLLAPPPPPLFAPPTEPNEGQASPGSRRPLLTPLQLRVTCGHLLGSELPWFPPREFPVRRASHGRTRFEGTG